MTRDDLITAGVAALCDGTPVADRHPEDVELQRDDVSAVLSAVLPMLADQFTDAALKSERSGIRLITRKLSWLDGVINTADSIRKFAKAA